jgi:hypothetical protein
MVMTVYSETPSIDQGCEITDSIFAKTLVFKENFWLCGRIEGDIL